MYIYIYVCIYIYMCVLRIYMYMCIYMYIYIHIYMAVSQSGGHPNHQLCWHRPLNVRWHRPASVESSDAKNVKGVEPGVVAQKDKEVLTNNESLVLYPTNIYI